MKNKYVVLVGIFFLLIIGIFLFQNTNNNEADSVSVKLEQVSSKDSRSEKPESTKHIIKKGEKILNISFEDFDGNTHKLSDFEGKGIIIDFWAAWCPFCVSEMPELEKAHKKYDGEVVIIGMHRSDTESINAGLKFSESRGVTYLLGSDADGSLYRATGGFGMPVAVYINKEGVVLEIKSGPKTAKEIDKKANELSF